MTEKGRTDEFDKDVIFGPPRHREQASECTRCGLAWPCPDAPENADPKPVQP